MPDFRLGKLRTTKKDGSIDERYVVTWWDGGKRKRFRLDAQSLPDAKSEAIAKFKRETVAPPEKTIADLWEAYRAEKEGRRVAVAMFHEWKAMGPHFGAFRPDQITTALCREYVDLRRRAGKHDGTIWTELGHLRTVLRWAFKDKAPSIERPAKPAPKDRWLTHAEIDRLLAVPMAHHIKLAILLMLSTAGRVGAILDLEWSRVDFDRNQIDLRVDAAGPRKGRAVVPMNAGLRAALADAKRAARTDYVIEWAGERVANIKTGFYAAVRAAKLEGVSPHTLRHTAAVHMAAAGRPMHRISQYLGHSNTQVTERVYARFAPGHLQEEADTLDFTKVRAAK